jgi:hypothetical protein
VTKLVKPTIDPPKRLLPPIPDGLVDIGERSRWSRVAKLALRRALGDASTADRSSVFGRRAAADTRLFQKTRGGLVVDGQVGPATWDALAPWIGDEARRYLDPTEVDSPRDRVVAQAWWWLRNASLCTYKQRRPMDALQHVPRVGDCSESATLCYRWAGLPDPNGNAYNGQGYTGTLIENGTRKPISAARPGDLVFYGRNGWPTHVAVMLDQGDGVMSFGSTPPRHWASPYYRSDAMYAHDYIGGDS